MVSELWKDSSKAKKKKKIIDNKLSNNYGEHRIELYGVDYRISSENQRDNDSIDMQRSLAMQFIEKKGGILVDEYVEEAESAFHKKAWEREGLVRLLYDVQEGKVNHVIFFKRDRLARDIDSARYVYNILRECGAKLSFTDKSEPPVDLTRMDFATEVIEMMHYASNNHESRKTQIRVSNVMYEIAKNGRITGGQPPIGYELVHIDGETYFKPIEKFKDTIKLIEDLYFEGLGLRLIARYLNGGEVKGKEQLKHPIEKPLTNHKVSKIWNDKNIDTILFNPIYTGYIHHNPNFLDEEPIIVKSPYVEAVRSDETQLKLNQLRKSKIRNTNNKKIFNTPYLLSGLIHCACCGEKYITKASQKKDGTKHAYYLCKNKFSSNPKVRCSASLTFRKTIIEEFVANIVFEILGKITTPDVYDISLNINNRQEELVNNQIKSLNEQLSKNNKKYPNYMKLLGELDLTNPNSAALREIYEMNLVELKKEESEINEKLFELEKEVQSAENEERNLELFLSSLKDFKGAFKLIPQTKLKQIIDNLFTDIIVDEKGNVIFKLAFKIEPKQSPIDTEKVVFGAMIGEPFIASDITFTDGQPLVHYNYFNYLNSVKASIHKHFWTFLQTIDKKLIDVSLHNIDYSDLKGYRNIAHLEQGVLKNYFESKANTHRSTRLAVINGISISKKTFFNIIDSFNASLEDLVEFVNSKENLSLNEHVILESFNFYSKANDDVFLDKLICSHCGNKFRSMSKSKNKYYRCTKARSDAKVKCNSIGVNEKYLKTYFENSNINTDNVKIISIKNGIIDNIEYA